MKENSIPARIWRALLLVVPFLLGTVGFCRAGESTVDALFLAISLYGMQVQDPTPNLLVELARWTAPLATAGGVMMIFASRMVRNFVRYLRGDSVAVYGPEEDRAALLAQLGPRGIEGESRFVRAGRYILLNGEEENFAFYERNREALAGRPVYLRSESLRAQDSPVPDLHLICPEETAARLFWKRRGLYEASVQCGHRLEVVFLGFGRLGEELLSYALQDNIFDPGQHITYHIFGDGAAFSAIHPQISAIEDEVRFHTGPWYGEIDLIQRAQLVVVLTQEGQLKLLQNLLLATTRGEIDVFAASGTGTALLSGGGRLRLYDWKAEAWTPDHILSDALYERAKRIHHRYCVMYNHAPETEEAREAEWQKLDAFTRYSNISSADYHEIRLQMLAAMGQPADAGEMPPECLDLLAHLEHIRWCRYHYLNNWRHGEKKDAKRRLHQDLVPYEALDDDEQEKDRHNIRLQFSVWGGGPAPD